MNNLDSIKTSNTVRLENQEVKFFKKVGLKELILLFDEKDFCENVFYSVLCVKDGKSKKVENHLKESKGSTQTEQTEEMTMINPQGAQEKVIKEVEIDRGVTTRDLLMECVRFYSIRMLVLHLKYLENNDAQLSQEILDKFEQTHPFDSLNEYIESKINGKYLIFF